MKFEKNELDGVYYLIGELTYNDYDKTKVGNVTFDFYSFNKNQIYTYCFETKNLFPIGENIKFTFFEIEGFRTTESLSKYIISSNILVRVIVHLLETKLIGNYNYHIGKDLHKKQILESHKEKNFYYTLYSYGYNNKVFIELPYDILKTYKNLLDEYKCHFYRF